MLKNLARVQCIKLTRGYFFHACDKKFSTRELRMRKPYTNKAVPLDAVPERRTE